jgi:hypothetical protein
VACVLLLLLGLGLGWPEPLLRSALDAARIVNGEAVTLAGLAP